MPGFPARLLRRVFGPTFRNARPVEHPETEFSADSLEALLAQTSGMNLLVPRASLVASYSGSSFAVTHQAEAWNPNEEQPHPVLARPAVGQYTYTFASSYLDHEGNDIATALVAARIECLRPVTTYANRGQAFAWVDAANPLVIQIRTTDAAGTAIDAPFWLEVL